MVTFFFFCKTTTTTKIPCVTPNKTSVHTTSHPHETNLKIMENKQILHGLHNKLVVFLNNNANRNNWILHKFPAHILWMHDVT